MDNLTLKEVARAAHEYTEVFSAKRYGRPITHWEDLTEAQQADVIAVTQSALDEDELDGETARVLEEDLFAWACAGMMGAFEEVAALPEDNKV